MSLVERDGIVFEKPTVPMNPKNSNWDVPLEKRMEELENKVMDLQVNLLTILKDILVQTGKEIEKENENNKNE